MEEKEIQIKADDSVLRSPYSNTASISHSPEEFTLDFLMIAQPVGMLVSRIIMSPGHAKRLLKALEENIALYEKNVGTIKPAEAPKKQIGFTR